MADIDIPISELPDGDDVEAGDKLVVNQGGTTKKIDALNFKGDTGPSGSLPSSIAEDIEDPIVLNSLDATEGIIREVQQVLATNDYVSLYKFDSATTETENPPYSVDGSGGMWLLIYSNAPNIAEKSFNDQLCPHGVVDTSETTLSFDDGTRTLTITLTGSKFNFYNQGKKFTKTSNDTKVITDTDGVWLFYYDAAGVLQSTQSAVVYRTHTTIAYLHWDGTSGILSEERHGLQMMPDTHQHLHEALGSLWEEGLTASGYTLDTDSDGAVTFGLTDGEIHDEDIEIFVVGDPAPSAPFEQILADPAEIPVVHLTTGALFTKDTATTFAFKNTGAGRVNYNKLNGDWAQAEVTDNSFVAYFIVATSSISEPIVAIQGQREDASLVGAQDNNQFSGLVLGAFVSKEISPLYRIILRTKDTFGGARKAKIIEVQDIRGLRVSEGTALNPTDHNGLTGLQGGASGERYHLTSAQHTAVTDVSTFVDADGVSGGQTINGGTDSTDDLILESNPNHDGKVMLGDPADEGIAVYSDDGGVGIGRKDVVPTGVMDIISTKAGNLLYLRGNVNGQFALLMDAVNNTNDSSPQFVMRNKGEGFAHYWSYWASGHMVIGRSDVTTHVVPTAIVQVIDNTSNTTPLHEINQKGSGDASQSFKVATKSWTHGIDNSESDAYKISENDGLGTNDRVVIEVGGKMSLGSGTGVNEFSTDGTLAGDSDDALPTEKAVKTYVDGKVKSVMLPVQSAKVSGSYIAIGARIDGGGPVWKLLFSASQTESGLWSFPMPAGFVSGLTAKIKYAMASATSGKIDIEVEVRAVADGEDVDSGAFAAVNEISGGTTVPGTAGLADTVSIPLANADSVAAGELVYIRVNRDHDDADDTATGDMEIRSIVLEYIG